MEVLNSLVRRSLPVGVHVNDVLRYGPISFLFVSGTPLLSLERFRLKFVCCLQFLIDQR